MRILETSREDGMRKFGWKTFLLVLALATAVPAGAQEAGADEAAELAKKLANPVASLISVPLQYNYDEKYGPDDKGSKSVLNIQPVWPFSLGKEWNLITRTIIPLVAQHDIPPGTEKSGIGDILQSFFFSPKEPVNGWILAVGPVILYPTASDDALGGGKWGAGPTVLALKQADGWTYGMLANHVESFAGQGDRAYISSTFVQPFLSYITKTKTTIGLNSESAYDWRNAQWSIPVNLSVSQLLKVGDLPMQVSAGVRYWAESPANGPEGFGFRAGITFLFPK
jgi:hypothetical protein